MSQPSEIVLWEPKPGLTISLQKGTVLHGQGKGTVVGDLAKLLSRLARLYQIPNWTPEDSVELADWTYENYKFELSDLVVRVLSSPPPSEKENWRLTPDTIAKWMAPVIEKQAEIFEREHQKQKLLPEPIAALPDKYLKQMQEIIEKSEGVKPIRPINAKDILAEGSEKPSKPRYVQTTEAEALASDRHFEWIKANYNLDGTKKPGWISEQEWK